MYIKRVCEMGKYKKRKSGKKESNGEISRADSELGRIERIDIVK